MKEAVIVDACRSAIGRAGDRGQYRTLGPFDLMVPVLQAIVERNKLDPNLIDDICMGSATLGGAMIRNILLYRRRFVGLANQLDDISVVLVKMGKATN